MRRSLHAVPPGWLQYSTRRRAGAHVDAGHHLGAGLARPVAEFVDADLVRLDRVPRAVEAHGALRARADAVAPVVAGEEVAAGVAHERDAQLAHEVEHVAAEALLVRGRVAGLVEARVDGASEVFDEGAEELVGDGADDGFREKRDGCVHCHFAWMTKNPESEAAGRLNETSYSSSSTRSTREGASREPPPAASAERSVA